MRRIPSIDTVITGDVTYRGQHAWLTETDQARARPPAHDGRGAVAAMKDAFPDLTGDIVLQFSTRAACPVGN